MEWISVKDKLPDQWLLVLVYTEHGGVEVDRYDMTLSDGTILFYGTREEYRSNVTHWMPLPEPPKQTK
jgi:hypothetical protein